MKALKLTLVPIIAGLSALIMISCGGSAKSGGDPDTLRFYVGSSDGSLEYSIFLCELDLKTNQFGVVDSFAGARGPSYLAFSPDGKTIYSIDKTVSDPETGFMTVSSFRVNKDNHRLELMNSQSSEGVGPCHIYCSEKGDYLFTANYGSGNIAAFPLNDEGAIMPASSVVQSSGTGPVENRQEGPHTHFVSLDSSGRFLLSPDLGSDKVLVYKFDSESGQLVPNPEQAFLKLKPGSGPRHLVFHPLGDIVFVVNELNSTVTGCWYDKETGVLETLNTVGTVRDSHPGPKHPAAIRIHPGGDFLFASTRGDESTLTVFKVEKRGRIYRFQIVENVPDWPRDFNIDPTGKYLLVAGERSNEIELFHIDNLSGKVSRSSSKFELPSPGCILFID